MEEIKLHARWKEELVASTSQGTIIFELTMGVLHVYFPDEQRWALVVPSWVKDKRQQYLDACKKWCSQNNVPISITDNAFVYELKDDK